MTDPATATATDLFNVTAAVTPTNPKTGDLLKVTIAGDDTVTTTTSGTFGPLTLQLASQSGATSTVTVPAAAMQVVTVTHAAVKIASVSDPAGRTWQVAADGQSASATA